MSGDNDFMDELHADGTVAGFFCYPLDTLREEEGSDKIFDFRDKLEEILADEEKCRISKGDRRSNRCILRLCRLHCMGHQKCA